MRRVIAVCAVSALGLLCLASTSSAGSSEVIRKCKWNFSPGVSIDVKTKTRIVFYCGPAKATVRMSGKTYKFTNGICFQNPDELFIGIGKLTSPGKTPRFKAFLLQVTAVKKGKYRNGLIRFQLPGRELESVKNTMVIRSGRMSGSFSGTFGSGARATGSFTCK